MFVIVEAVFSSNHSVAKIPVMLKDLFNVVHMMDQSKSIVNFKVVDGFPVNPEYFGFAPIEAWDKWVTEFTAKTWER